MKMRRRFCLIILLATLFFISCDWWRDIFYEPPPNLRLFLKKENAFLFNPIYASDGKKVYYLAAREPPWFVKWLNGPLWVIGVDGKNDRRLLEGNFGGLAISPDGSKLALISGSIGGERRNIIIIDTSGLILDTVFPSQPKVIDIEFSNDGRKIYFYACGGASESEGFYRVNLDGTEEELVLPEPSWVSYWFGYFDLFPNDSIYYLKGEIWNKCQISPKEPNKVVMSHNGGGPPEDLLLRDLLTNKDSLLNAKPFYQFNVLSDPYWTPCGKEIIFTASKRTIPSSHKTGWLWILEYK